MLSFTPHPAGGLASPRLQTATVCVVDPRSEDYDGWQALALSAGVLLEFVSSSQQALRIARQQRVDLWVINADLPKLSGVMLVSMLKSQNERATVYLVADRYEPGVERAARQARATLFGCKGAHSTWLGDWLQTRSRHRCMPKAKRAHRALASP